MKVNDELMIRICKTKFEEYSILLNEKSQIIFSNVCEFRAN